MSTYYVAGVPYSSELYHHGIKGQRWGIRRFQNPDRTLTPAGKERYSTLKGQLKVREKELQNAEAKLDAAVKARKDYRDAKKNRNNISGSDFYAKKQLAKSFGTRRQIKQRALDMEQARWKRDVVANRIAKLDGGMTVPISKISPKVSRVGKRIAAGVLGTVGFFAVAVAIPSGPAITTTLSAARTVYPLIKR